MRHQRILIALIAITAAGVSAAPALFAQQATPDASSPVVAEAAPATPVPSSAGISLFAGGLANPRGFTWSTDGAMYVALAGSGGTTMTESDSPHEQQFGPFFQGDTASVVRIDIVANIIEQGCPATIAGGLPSTRGMSGHDQGPAAVAFLGEQMYILQDAGSAALALPEFPNGVYAVNPDGSVRLVADIKQWHDENPVAHVPGDLTDESETFAMLAGPGFLWVLESNSGQVLKVTTEGAITRVADLSEGHPVPTGFALSPNGGVYVAFLTPAPYVDGTSRVVEVAEDGTVTEVWTGLTMVTGLATDSDGTLYALEMATGNTDEAPFVNPGTGRIVRQTGPDSLAEVVVGLDFPIAMAMGPDNALYVAFPAFGASDALGGILRADLSYPQPMRVSPGIMGLSVCDVVTPVPATPSADMPAASPEAMGAATPSGSPPSNADGKSATGAQAIEISNYSFNPVTFEVPAGTTVTWTNTDSVSHTVTAGDGAFNSGNLNNGQAFSHQVDTAGTYTYGCSYHPNMQATVVVT
jgi:plastocyanin